jgi:diaminopimelate decarboxylase
VKVAGSPHAELAEAGDKFGTPLYVLLMDKLRANLDQIARDLAPDQVLYSLKTNYLPPVTAAVRERGFGVDVVSGYELQAALRAGFPGESIVFNGPVKTPDELRAAVAAGAFVNVDGLAEIDVLAAGAAQAGKKVKVGLRVFPPQDVYAGPPPLPARPVPSKFGWPIVGGDADRVVRAIRDRPGLILAGVHCHLGSQITSVPAHVEALTSVIAWAARISEDVPLETINLGGGFGVPGIQRVKGAQAGLSQVRAATAAPGAPEFFDPAELATAVHRLLAEHHLSRLRVSWEPGRAVVSDAMILLTRVAAVKRTADGNWVLLDGGLNLLPTAGVAERHAFDALRQEARPESFLLGGPLCYEGDIFSLDAQLPADIREGDFVAIHDAGAYSITRATSFNRPRAAVVMVDDGQLTLCWRAETDDDIFRFNEPVRATA